MKHGPPEYDRAELGIDGNAAYALLGPNIQEGEVEFVEIVNSLPHAALDAAKMALERLRGRLNKPYLSYFLGSGLQK